MPKRKPRPRRRAEHAIGGQPDNQNARKHGFYSRKLSAEERALVTQFCVDDSLDYEIALQRLANQHVIDTLDQTSEGEIRARLFIALTTGLGRVASLMRSKRALSGKAADSLTAAIATALDELSSEIGRPL